MLEQIFDKHSYKNRFKTVYTGSVFISSKKRNDCIYYSVHVDDIAVVGSTDAFEEYYINKLKEHVGLKFFDEVKQLLGMQLRYENEKLFVNQKNYVTNLLRVYGIWNMKYEDTDGCKPKIGGE